MISARHFIVATAGHVDHGKSSLVRALTGTDPDRLPEEKARGITIELGFAQLRLANDESHGPELNLGIVDVPGHEDFVKNMVAGVGAIDLALLTVAADDGWMPQTEEHLHILGYLGVARGVVALTKIDRIEPAAEARAIAAVRERLAGSALATATIVPTSVRTGHGLDALREAIRAALGDASARADLGRPRLWIDRAFNLHGVGTVVTGTLTGGVVKVGDTLAAAGKSAVARIRSLHSHQSSLAAAAPGMRVALNVVGAAGESVDLARGDLLMSRWDAVPRGCCDVLLQRSPRATHGEVAHDTVVRLHAGTTAVACRLIFADAANLAAGESRLAQLRLAAPLALIAGDRFVLRDSRGRATLAGGVVLRPDGDPRDFRQPGRRQMLAALSTALGDPLAYVSAMLSGEHFLRDEELRLWVPFGAGEIERAIASGVATGAWTARHGVIADTEAWTMLRDRAERLIAEHLAAHPSQNGLPVASLRAALRDRETPRHAVEAVIADLTNTTCEIAGAAIRRRGFRAALPAGLEAAAARLVGTLRRAGLNPPNRHELARTPAECEALEFLLKTGKAVALAPDTVLLAGVFAAAREKIRAHLGASGGATVSELRVLLGTSRRVMVPLLEKLDAAGVTRRDGEYRRLHASAAPVRESFAS